MAARWRLPPRRWRRDNLRVKPEKRDIGMVFQSYAIWPHMTVFENVAFPLNVRGIRAPRSSRRLRMCSHWSAWLTSPIGRRCC